MTEDELKTWAREKAPELHDDDWPAVTGWHAAEQRPVWRYGR